MYDFTTPAAQHVADSLKWRKYAGRDVLPLWVADMDFLSPPVVTAALAARVAQGIFAYGEPTETAVGALLAAARRDYDWTIEPNWLVPLPGLVTGLNVACRASGDGDVITATPIYPPFMSAPQFAERRLIRLPLRETRPDTGSHWEWDFDALDAVATRGATLMLCHPHNPVGRQWTPAELQRLGELAEKHDLTVISDEIHCDLLLEPGARHTPFAAISPKLAARTITLMAPSKTYNVPGLGCAFAVIPNAERRHAFQKTMRGIVPHVNLLGYVALEAACRDGMAWRSELLSVLRSNRDEVVRALDGHNGLRVTVPQATFLAWVDCRDAGLQHPQHFFEQAGVGLSDGADFGAPGFVRLNFGCPRTTLDSALARMRKALATL
ncbi:MalY/PatB family protein [Jeongeupia chitinilytica]|uniref:Putative 8-amino-7-oxononanoate synthase n=1 Tax=Jeongeupia chitinilytica TaxID=1041641 RepID=A0ABQ3H2K4_9NEIS|nr:PatB family C-S lyase [Jeongeupia chitinilytica]GHD62560.1 aspartate aminotransferase [Jeongeupia chitinilytica]